MNRLNPVSVFSLVCVVLIGLCLSNCAPSGSGTVSGSGSATGGSSSLNDSAKFLAGMGGGGSARLKRLRNTPEWKAHAAQMDKLWSYHRGRASQLRSFRGQAGVSASTVFYPFGGPDYLHADALFSSSTYVLVGLEGVDSMPDLESLSDEEIFRGLRGIANSLKTVTGASYFITKDMRVDLQSTRFRGTLPLILVMAARSGQNISSAQPVGISSGGSITSRSAGSACPGWQIKAGGRTIYYFKKDLSNGGLRDSRLLKFVSSRGSHVTFVKSASYLMHGGGFSTIKNYILNNSKGIIQCPSGIPYRDIKNAGWKIKLYGNYTGPMSLFSSKHQSDLAAAYRTGSPHPVKPIKFGMGYLVNPSRACVIVGTR
ncbi:MAG: hypothetical protein AAF226_01905 [Verrucomicrobiota bacterium]